MSARLPDERDGRKGYVLHSEDYTGSGGIGCCEGESVAYCRSLAHALMQAGIRERDRVRVERMEDSNAHPLDSRVVLIVTSLDGSEQGTRAYTVAELLALPDSPDDEGAWWDAYDEQWYAADPGAFA